eukprot:92459_1
MHDPTMRKVPQKFELFPMNWVYRRIALHRKQWEHRYSPRTIQMLSGTVFCLILLSFSLFIFFIFADNSCPILDIDQDCIMSSNHSIPNIVHWNWFPEDQTRDLHFWEFLSLKSIRKFSDPCILRVFVREPAQLSGHWWERARNELNLTVKRPLIETELISGTYPMHDSHHSALLRLWSLRIFGGIYVDPDVWLLRPLSPLMNHSMVAGKRNPLENVLSNSFMLASPGSKFLGRMLRSFEEKYRPDHRDFNANMHPSQLAVDHPDEIYIRNDLIWPGSFEAGKFYHEKNANLSEAFGVRLWEAEGILGSNWGEHDLMYNSQNTTLLEAARRIYYD